MYKTIPKLSIITVNLNNAKGLQKTIESVVSQIFTDYEYIIIDGGSTDGSVDIIKKYADKITYWVSEPDKGIYNAMNKGIKVAKGEYCQFLNSGDWLINKKVLKDVFDLGFNEDIVYGNILLDNKQEIIFPRKITLLFFIKGGYIPHPASFIKRKLLFDLGLYDERLSIVSDWKFFMSAIIIHNASIFYLNKLISVFYSGGISSNIKSIDEKKIVFTDLFPLIYDDYILLINKNKECVNKLKKYKNSRIIKTIDKIRLTNFYQKLKIVFLKISDLK